MRIALLQTALVWENPLANRKAIKQALSSLEPSDLLVLPEMFTTGFSMRAEALAESMSGETVDWMKELAKAHQLTVCGSIMIHSKVGFTNRFIWVTPAGDIEFYDKRHLFRMSGEHEHYTAGQSTLRAELQGFRCRPLICYDLRFPVYARNVANSFDLMLVVANWPAARATHWRTLLAARAIENQCFVVGVNRLGTDGNQVSYQGDSMILDFQGEPIVDASAQPGLFYAELDLASLSDYRAAFPAWMDQDRFNLE